MQHIPAETRSLRYDDVIKGSKRFVSKDSVPPGPIIWEMQGFLHIITLFDIVDVVSECLYYSHNHRSNLKALKHLYPMIYWMVLRF